MNIKTKVEMKSENESNDDKLSELATAICSAWSSDMPTEEGCYWMTCVENDGGEDFVPVYWENGRLLCDPPGLGARYPIASVHDGLTDTKWRSAIKVSQNVKDSQEDDSNG